LTAEADGYSRICEGLTSLGIKTGDVALVHSDAIVAGQFRDLMGQQPLDVLIRALQEVVGADGTIVMPTFSYSFTDNKPFDVLNTPSRVGMVTEYFRRLPEVKRSPDPIFSVAAKGRMADDLTSIPVGECFGGKSVFAALRRLNCHVICLGCSLSNGGTFVHYVEKSHTVDYRYDKEFHGTLIWPDGRSTRETAVYYVRDLQRQSVVNLRRFQGRLEAKGLLSSGAIGRVKVLGVRAEDFFATAWKMLDEDPVSLIEEGSRRVDG
jgi:aminoglycoside 3-N-acetyltransferase